jgi:toxin ParE1/3/4
MKIKISPKAAQDIDAIYNYIKSQNQIAAPQVIRNIKETFFYIEKYPNIGRKGRLPETREYIMPSLPYFIAYRVTSKNLEILRIYHTSRLYPSFF